MSVNSCPHSADVFARLKGLGVVSPLGNGYSVVKVRVKGFKIPLTCLNWESRFWGGIFQKIFILLLIWTKGGEMHTHFRWFERKIFENFFPEKSTPSLICTSSPKCIPKMSGFKEMFTKNSHILLSGNIYPSTYLDKGY